VPRYDYECQSCGDVREHVFRMAEKPDTLPCECGGVSASLIADGIQVIFKDNQLPIHLDKFDVPIGWERGNTDPEVQEARYAKKIREERKRVREYDKTARKNNLRLIASVPRELHRKRQRQFGKDYWQDDTKKKLKRDGMLHVD